MTKIDPRRIVSTDSPSMRRLIAVLEAHGPMNGRTLCERAHVAFNTFQNQYRHMLQAAGKIHLHAWEHNHRGPFVPVYAVGPSTADAPRKPKKLDQLARSRNWKERTGYNAARKAMRQLARPKDKALSALLGLGS